MGMSMAKRREEDDAPPEAQVRRIRADVIAGYCAPQYGSALGLMRVRSRDMT